MRLIAILALLASQNAPPKDFSVRISFTTCVAEDMDTATGHFRRSLGTGAEASAKVRLTAADLRKVYDAVVAAKFWELPERLEPIVTPDGTITVTSPGTLLKIEVRRDRSSRTVQYDTGRSGSADPRIERFNGLFKTIADVFRDKPQVKSLPGFQVFCL